MIPSRVAPPRADVVEPIRPEGWPAAGQPAAGQPPGVASGPRERLAQALERARPLLPAQGPIGTFIHHNTLHAFQHLPFEAAVLEARRALGGEPYLSEARYRDELARGRILERDIDLELDLLEGAGPRAPEPQPQPEPDDLPPGVERRALRRLLLLRATHPDAGGAGLRWLLDEGGLWRRLSTDAPAAARARIVADTRAWLAPWLDARARGSADGQRLALLAITGEPDLRQAETRLSETLGLRPADLPRALWSQPEALAALALHAACRRQAPTAPAPGSTSDPAPDPAATRHRDRLLALTGEDADDLTHAALIRWVSAFLDQGLAYWPMPLRERGLLRGFVALGAQRFTLEKPFLRGLQGELAALAAREATSGLAAEDVVCEVLGDLGVPAAAWPEHVARTLQALPGWAGMFAQLEADPGLALGAPLPARLVDLLAVRLLIERRALADVARRHLGPGARLDALPPAPAPAPDPEREAWRLRQLCELLGAAAPAVLGWTPAQVAALRREVAAFDPLTRRGLWHRAYERRHREVQLAGLAGNRGRAPHPAAPAPLQAIFCIDDRAEGLRRHLEETGGARVETFGGAGFFGLAIEFRGLDDARPSNLCPVALRPEHAVHERPLPGDAGVHAARRRRRRVLSGVGRGALVGSRSLVRGALVTLGVGLASALPLVVRTLFPRAWSRLVARLHAALVPSPRTELTALRDPGADLHPGADPRARPLGFTVDEAADRVARLLEDAGLVGRLGALVALVGHASSTVNNPHASAYDCGACGGHGGAPNARLFAHLANDPRVRAALGARGVAVTAATRFVGAVHDTTTDQVTWLDADDLPAPHAERLRELRQLVDRAQALSAHERCRRFESAPRGLTPAEARIHVQGRALDLAEPRPEYNHGTNAVCVVGRRALTRGLFLDRRAFLVSYDPTHDPQAHLLTRLLRAVGPVGAGINLEYYFSTVDNERYGCGTKLPHNVTGLLGVMNGHQSDLRTGLPYQTLDIHEPVRLLTIVEATPATLLEVTRRDPVVAELVVNRWLQLVSLDPDTGALQVLGEGPPGGAGGGFAPLQPPPDLRPPLVPTSADWYAGRREHLAPALVSAGLEAAC